MGGCRFPFYVIGYVINGLECMGWETHGGLVGKWDYGNEA